MEKRRLGKSDLYVAPLCLGGNVFGWTADEAMSFKLLDAFIDAGFNFVDTADVYSKWAPGHHGGESEIIIGDWLRRRGKRDDVIIATKVGSEMGPGKTGLSKAYITRAVEDSLRRLGTEYIDLYQSHRDDPDTRPEETLEAYSALIKAGKVRAIGASNFTAERLAESLEASAKHGLPRYETLQPEYNLMVRDFERELAPLCTRHDIGVIPYFGLASGFLTGKYRSKADLKQSPRGEDVEQYLNERGFKVLATLDQIAARSEATPAQVALAWLMTRVTAPIASATNPKQLADLVGSARLKLHSSDVAKLEVASA
ncbi:aldo/keto reductase [Dongia deserti]|uniref:aldo/keto reductase n=1 Tax=Dongia deserti TaxID=2268030 RepID=UPI000E64DFAC|nr:aldo/keto reductase [Dongia deserti]